MKVSDQALWFIDIVFLGALSTPKHPFPMAWVWWASSVCSAEAGSRGTVGTTGQAPSTSYGCMGSESNCHAVFFERHHS